MIEIERVKPLRHYASQYSDLLFVTVDLKKPYNGYDKLILMGYRINDKDYENCRNHPNKVNTKFTYIRDYNTPDYDIETGNIHPSKERIEKELKKNKKGLIKQILLATNRPNGKSHAGPNKEAFIEYENLPKLRKCYYPLLEKNGDDYDPNLKDLYDKLVREGLAEEITK